MRKHYPQEGQDQEQRARHFSSTFSGSSIVIFTADSGVSSTTINNVRYADDTTLMEESEEELKSLLMKRMMLYRRLGKS